jgi:hypothetical protein
MGRIDFFPTGYIYFNVSGYLSRSLKLDNGPAKTEMARFLCPGRVLFLFRSQFTRMLVGRSVNSVTLIRTTSAIGKACERRTSRR